MKRICTIEGCGKRVSRRGWCQKHYQRWYRYGDPLILKKYPNGTLLKWLEDHTAYHEKDCLIWPFGKNHDGRGHVLFMGKQDIAHRVMCTLSSGDPPTPEHEASHICGKGRNGCVNPTHLIWETHVENHARRISHGTSNRGVKNAGGNKLTEENVIEIRRLYASGNFFQKDLGAKFGISQSMVGYIIANKKWGWLSH